MEVPSWLSKLILFGSILTAIAANLTNIKPAYGIAAMVVAGVIGALSDGVKSFILPAGVTAAGLLLTAAAVIGFVILPANSELFAWVPAHVYALLAQVGPILAVIGGKLKDVNDPAPAN